MHNAAHPKGLGIYEKTMLPVSDWAETFTAACQAGFDFFELSIDATEERQQRLKWSTRYRSRVRQAAAESNVRIRAVTLSAHRIDPWGSADPGQRRRADELASQTIDLAADLGAECVQIAGYFAFDGPRAENARELFLRGLERAASQAADLGLLLAIENVDGEDVTSVTAAQDLLASVNASNVRLYIDVGNLTGNNRNVLAELRVGLPDAYCVQLKDARPGVFRRVHFGQGDVPFNAIFDELVNSPPVLISVEMWNDAEDPALPKTAADWVNQQWSEALARRQPPPPAA